MYIINFVRITPYTFNFERAHLNSRQRHSTLSLRLVTVKEMYIFYECCFTLQVSKCSGEQVWTQSFSSVPCPQVCSVMVHREVRSLTTYTSFE